MTALLTADAIQRDDFSAVLSRYADVAPVGLAELDHARYCEIPTRAKERAYITKEELVQLVVWKVSHGKFRPSLKKLASENDAGKVEKITKEALSLKDPAKALKVLTDLRGVGPATAALLLSVCNPVETPFFSDELFRWCLWEDKAGGRWDRVIKYNVKEYAELTSAVNKLRKRLGEDNISAVDCEKVAYVLGKTEVDLSVPTESAVNTIQSEKLDAHEKPAETDEKQTQSTSRSTKKRSAVAEHDTAPGKRRRSARTNG